MIHKPATSERGSGGPALLKMRLQWDVTALLAAALVTPSAQVAAASASTPGPTPASIDYSLPGQLVSVDGRILHLRCVGEGSPTVVLIPGLGDSTIVWHLVQPQLAAMTRVCAWDRAGFGFSGPSPRNQSAIERARDLERALRGAGIAGPFVIVGHSLGAYEALVFGDRHHRDLRGMVLVDPAVPDQRNALARQAPQFEAYDRGNFDKAVVAAQRCEVAVREHRIKPGDPDPDGCFQYPDYYPEALKGELAKLDMNSVRVATQISLYQNDATRADGRSREVLNPKRNYADLPLIVLSAGAPFTRSAASKAVMAEASTAQAEWWQAHVDLSKLSARGIHRIVPGTSHYIQLMQPGAVIQAISEIVSESRQGR